MNILIYTAILALGSAFVLALCHKWGWIDWMQIHAPNEYFHALVSCHLCTTFWTAALLGCVIVIFTREPAVLAAIPLSVPIGMRLW